VRLGMTKTKREWMKGSNQVIPLQSWREVALVKNPMAAAGRGNGQRDRLRHSDEKKTAVKNRKDTVRKNHTLTFARKKSKVYLHQLRIILRRLARKAVNIGSFQLPVRTPKGGLGCKSLSEKKGRETVRQLADQSWLKKGAALWRGNRKKGRGECPIFRATSEAKTKPNASRGPARKVHEHKAWKGAWVRKIGSFA